MTAAGSASNDSRLSVSAIAYDSPDFEQVLAAMGRALADKKGARLVLLGASRTEKQEVMGRIAEETALNIHQYNLGNLLGRRFVETQGNLREVFDKASEEAALLFFDRTDALFEAQGEATAKADREPVPVDYFFHRVGAFKGVVLLCLESDHYLEQVRSRGVDVIVTF